MTVSISQAVIPTAERSALIDLYNNTDGSNWTNNSNWMGDIGTESTWHGITCDGTGTHVTEIQLHTNQLSGTIPPELDNLTNLRYIHLGHNQISGAMFWKSFQTGK